MNPPLIVMSAVQRGPLKLLVHALHATACMQWMYFGGPALEGHLCSDCQLIACSIVYILARESKPRLSWPLNKLPGGLSKNSSSNVNTGATLLSYADSTSDIHLLNRTFHQVTLHADIVKCILSPTSASVAQSTLTSVTVEWAVWCWV